MSYRPITDVWILARPKVAYYGAYPSGFLARARALLGVHINDSVLHVCSGMVRNYPFSGLGPNDKTVDINEDLKPDYVCDVAKQELPLYLDGWPAILADPPYTPEDADHYTCGRESFPDPRQLLARCLDRVRAGGRVGFLHYAWPRPPDWMGRIKCVALVGVITGYNNRMRAFSVFEKVKELEAREAKRDGVAV